MKIALVGDYNPNVTAHRAIPAAIEISSNEIGINPSIEWLDSKQISIVTLSDYSGFWVIPASPYQDMASVLHLIKFARENNTPFLGTCGGYQHAALEFAKTVLGFENADNSEVNPNTTMPLISSLVCRLSNQAGQIQLAETSMLSRIYGATRIDETYNCGFGVNSQYLNIFDDSELNFVGFDSEGDPKALELTNHKFFIGTAFQPERLAFKGSSHPVIEAFINATTYP